MCTKAVCEDADLHPHPHPSAYFSVGLLNATHVLRAKATHVVNCLLVGICHVTCLFVSLSLSSANNYNSTTVLNKNKRELVFAQKSMSLKIQKAVKINQLFETALKSIETKHNEKVMSFTDIASIFVPENKKNPFPSIL